MRELVILRGLQGSGKSTFAYHWVSEHPDTRTCINRDNIRITYFNSYWGDTVNETTVTEIEHTIGDSIMRTHERDIIIDGTNLKDEQIIPWITLAQKHGYLTRFVDMHITVDEAIRRDLLRDKKVGETVIRSYYEKYFINGKFPQQPTIN